MISLSLTSLFRLHGGEASSSWGRCQPGDSKTSSSIFNSKSVKVCSSLILGGRWLGSCTCCCIGVDERRGIPCPSPCTGCGWCSRWECHIIIKWWSSPTCQPWPGDDMGGPRQPCGRGCWGSGASPCLHRHCCIYIIIIIIVYEYMHIWLEVMGMVWSSWSWCPLPGWGWWACPRSCQRSRPSARRLCPCHLAEDQVETMIVIMMTINDIYNNPDQLQSGCWPWRLKAQPVLEKAWRLERGSAISYFWGSRSGSGSQ